MGLFDRIKRAIAGGPAAGTEVKPSETAFAETAAATHTTSTNEAAPGETLEAIVSYVVELSENRLRAAEIDAEGDIFEYGYVDSLRVTQLFEFIEQRWSVVVPEAEIVGRLNTLKALAEFIDS